MAEIARRQLLSGAAAMGALGVMSPALCRQALADADRVTLKAVTRVIEVRGKAATVLGIEQPDGTQGLATASNRRFRTRLENHLSEATLIHWHGLTPPSEQDGVPGLSQPALEPGGSYLYDFALKRPGTFWMHSHVGLQEQRLLAAPLIVRDPTEAGLDEQEVVILLHDFTFKDPEEIFAGLRVDAMSMHGGHGTQVEQAAETQSGHAGHSVSDMGEAEAMPGTEMAMEGGHMSGHGHGDASGHMMGEIHYNDIDFDAYLANDRTLADPEVLRVEPAGRLRLRIINAAAATNFHIDLGALQGDLIAVDGSPVTPVRGKRFPLAIAQRIDLRLNLPAGQGAYPVLALREDDTAQTGVILATKSAAVGRVSEMAKMKAPPLDLELEKRLTTPEQPRLQPSDRRLLLELNGSHMRYDWNLNGKAFDPDDPITVRHGETVEIAILNKTSMPHPMHLHGHRFQVVGINGVGMAGALRDTVLVPPDAVVKIAFLADNPGHWAFHCHQLYHMRAGMMTSLRYSA